MSYLSLSRKYRPRQFVDMIGQEAATTAIKNAIHLKREPHSIVFSGVRGIGKTTMARLYAKALNCASRDGSDPCDHCDSCIAINEGRHEDVLEIDGASHTGVDDIRALQETLSYVPQRSRYKIYTIDEVHMLSQSAFNALLKTLEEPPAHIVFIFATTELQKIPETILSRCQVFHLRRLTIPMIVQRLTEIMQQENLEFETEALALIAREGRGSMRDALTLLDQVITIGEGRASMAAISSMVQTTSSAAFLTMLEALLSKDAARVARLIADWDGEGWDLVEATEQLAGFIRHAFVVRDLGREALDVQMLGLSVDEVAQLERLCGGVQDFDLNRLFRTIRTCSQDLDGGSLDRYILENYCFEWCFDPGLPQIDDWKALFRTGMSLGSSPGSQRAISSRSSESHLQPTNSPSVQRNSVQQKPNNPSMSLKDRLLKTVRQEGRPSAQQAASERAQSTSSESITKGGENDGDPDPGFLAQRSASSLQSDVSTAEMQEHDGHLVEVSRQAHAAKNDQILVPVTASTGQARHNFEKARLSRWPDNWREMVSAWMERKPLQARLLEETYIIQYSSDLIHVAVDEDSMAAKKLFAIDARSQIVEELGELFGFKGQLKVSTRKPVIDGSSDASVNKLPESQDRSLLDIKRQEKKIAKQKRRRELVDHPLTQELVRAFGGSQKDDVCLEVSFKDGED